MSSEENNSESTATKNPPWLRNKNDLALWPTKEGDKAVLSGHVTVDGVRIDNVRAFLNTKDKDGVELKQPYLALSRNTAAKGEDPKWETFANGNAMNTRSDGKPVYFDQVIFNAGRGEDSKTFSAYVGKGCPAEFQKELGFTSEQVQRPAREEPAAGQEHEEEEAASPSP